METEQPLTLGVLLHDTGMERVVQPMLGNMSRLGIAGSIRIVVNQFNRLRLRLRHGGQPVSAVQQSRQRTARILDQRYAEPQAVTSWG
ncbi:hypothetical protein DSL92_00460 [Billgrantia gudaonensis]|uniref:Uncharacterized protein n=1 Tax=Billgrantia gudaonensis TaxID=376427 RepID=A0A3S0VTA8_9GAMM|nr:hypothetical protein DSL92_00460 [Halomonas gudaonensis]